MAERLREDWSGESIMVASLWREVVTCSRLSLLRPRLNISRALVLTLLRLYPRSDSIEIDLLFGNLCLRLSTTPTNDLIS